MKTKIGIAILLMMVSMNLSASVLGKISKHAVKRTAAQYLQSCEGGDMPACHKLGFAYKSADGVELDHKKAQEYYKKACDGGYYDSCYFLGSYYQEDRSDIDALAKGAKLHILACDGGIDWAASACFSAGLDYKNGTGVEKDLSKAVEYFKKNIIKESLDCKEEPNNTSCSIIKECESFMSRKNDGHPILDKALKLLIDECDNGGNANSCRLVSAVYQNKYGGYEDKALLEKYIQAAFDAEVKSCDSGTLSSCRNIILTHLEEKDIDNAIRVAQIGQALGDGKAFTCLAEAYQEGDGVEKDTEKANSLYLKAVEPLKRQCDNNNAEDACVELGMMYSYGNGVPQDKALEDFYYKKGCTRGSEFGCVVSGLFDEGKAIDLKRCEEGYLRACKNLEPEKAKEVYKIKCLEGEDGEACFEYSKMLSEYN